MFFITQSYFKVPKEVRLNTKHFVTMEIPNKRELQQIAINHSSDIDLKIFWIYNKIVTIDDYIKDEKIQYDLNRQATNSAVSSGKINKYKYLTREEILSSNQKQITE